MNKIIKGIKNPFKIFVYLGYRGWFKWMNDKTYLKFMFRGLMNQKLDLNNPKSFSEKLQWLKLYNRKDEYTLMVDKYEVRKYISDTIGPQYLIPLINVWNKYEEIGFEMLPKEFVLKPTHTSGDVYICSDKDKINFKVLNNIVNGWMRKEYYWFYREWPYKNVKPKIICEKYMVDESGTELKDYKVLCFNGIAKFIEVHKGRFTKHIQSIYDLNWNKTNIIIGKEVENSNIAVEKPKCFDEMIELSEKLAMDLAHVRIDWYIIKDKLFFGEITFFDASGLDQFYNYEDDIFLGSYVQLP